MFGYPRKLSNALLGVALLLSACGGKKALEERAPRLAPSADAGQGPALSPSSEDGGRGTGAVGHDASVTSAPDGASTSCDTTSTVCDPVRNCGCPSGETCDLINVAYSAVPVCRPLPAQATPAYSACLAQRDCPAAHSCLGGVCRAICASSADCTWPGGACFEARDEAGIPIYGLKYCARQCDPVSPQAPAAGFQACGAGLQCHPFGFPQVADCNRVIANKGEGEDCTDYRECAPGLNCAPGGRCRAWCTVGGNDCAPGFHCDAFASPLVVAGRELGTCSCQPLNGDVCDPVSGCGCSAQDTTCGLASDLTPFCRNTPPYLVEPYSACSTDSYCPALHSCVDGACKRHCATAADCPWPGAACVPMVTPNGTREGWNVCTLNCDLTTTGGPRSCGVSTQCMPTSDFQSTDCKGPWGVGLPGYACARPEDCGPPMTCGNNGQPLPAGSLGKCRAWCSNIGSDAGCAPAETCLATSPPSVIAGVELGVCGCAALSGECNPVNGCGCNEWTTCGLDDVTRIPGCRDLLADSPFFGPYQACTSNQTCPALHSCLDGVCTRLCNTPADCGWSGARCVSIPGLSGAAAPELGKCTRHCDLASPDIPAAGFQACSYGFLDDRRAPLQCVLLQPSDGQPPEADCAAAGENAVGAACATASDCQPGLFCRAGSCRRWCRLGLDACDAGFTCNAFAPPLVVGGVEYGACEAE